MPLLSAYTELGHLELTSEPTLGERFHQALMAAMGGQYSTEEGSRQEAHLYAQAMELATAAYCYRRAGAQADPATVLECLRYREAEHRIVPNLKSSIELRRRDLQFRSQAPKAPTRANMEAALQILLGDDFLSLGTTAPGSAAIYPDTTLGQDQPLNLVAPETPRRILSFVDAVTTLGVPVTVEYVSTYGEERDEDDVLQPNLLVGSTMVVSPDVPALMERVEIEACEVDPAPPAVPTRTLLTATFTKPHPAGAIATTQPWPYWISTQRHFTVYLTEEAAEDPEKRRRVHALMQRMVRGVSTWDIAAGAGPFIVAQSKLGLTPM